MTDRTVELMSFFFLYIIRCSLQAVALRLSNGIVNLRCASFPRLSHRFRHTVNTVQYALYIVST